MGNAKLVLQRHQLIPRSHSLAPHFQVFQSALNRDPQILKINGLGNKVERPPIHGRTDVFHIAISRDNDSPEVWIDLGHLFEQRETIHPRHIDVRKHHIDIRIRVQHLESLNAVVGKDEFVVSGANIAPHALPHEMFEIGFVINNEYLVLRLFHISASYIDILMVSYLYRR